MKTIEINVTQDDINKGIKSEPKSCPIARAVRRIANKKRVRMGLVTLFIAKKNFRVPQEVTTFVNRFDYGKQVKPFTFTIKS